MPSFLNQELDSKEISRRSSWLFGRNLAALSCGLALTMMPIFAVSAEIETASDSSSEASRQAPVIPRSPAGQPDIALLGSNSANISTPPTQGPGAEEPASSKALLIPIARLPYDVLRDTFSEGRRSGRIHDAIDIMAREGTPVLAVTDGTIAHLCKRGRGGLSIYQFDEDGKFVYFYAHLHSYSRSLTVGKKIRRGEIIGYVGHSGNASARAPHLHFAMATLDTENRWWGGDAINPYPLFQR